MQILNSGSNLFHGKSLNFVMKATLNLKVPIFLSYIHQFSSSFHHIFVVFPLPFCCLSVAFSLYFCYISVVFLSPFHHISVVFPSYFHRLFIVFLLYFCCILCGTSLIFSQIALVTWAFQKWGRTVRLCLLT